MIKKLIILLGLASACVWAQQAGGVYIGPARRVIQFQTLPATCGPGDIAYQISDTSFYNCATANTWTKVGSGSGGGGGGASGYSATTATIVNGAAQFVPFIGGATSNSTETNVSLAAPAALTFSNLSIKISAAVGASATFAVTLQDATVGQALTCTTASGGTTCTDTTHSVNVAQGDLIDFKIVGTGTITAATPILTISYAVGTSSVGITSITTTGPITGGPITTTGAIACATCGVTGTGLQQFAATTSAQFAGVISDETGTGLAVFATTPTLTTPVLGAATATTVNKVTITAPASAATLTIPDGVTFTGPAASGTAATLGNTNTLTGRQDATGAASTAPMKTGTSLPGTCIVGDLYFKSDATAGQNIYECQSTNTWTQQLNSGGGGGGTVTVVGAGSLTSTACVTGGGTTTIQTPSATCTIDSSGNISTPGGISTGVGGSVAGHEAYGQGTAFTAPTSSVGFQAPTSVTTKFMMTLPAAPVTGFMLNTGTSDPSVISYVATIPVANGGTGTGSTLTGLVRGNSSAMTAAELSGDVTTSGSNAVTIAANAVTSAKMNITTTSCTAPKIVTAISAGGVGTCAAPDIPQGSHSAAYTTVLADDGTQILHPTADNNARTFTIDSNANVAYPIGATLVFVNQINTLTIAITSDTLQLAGTATTGSRTLAVGGIATAVKITSTLWFISGPGLT